MSLYEMWLSDDSALAPSQTISTAAGVTSAPLTFHFWMDKGVTGTSENNVWLAVQVLKSGVWVFSGVPALDNHEFMIQVTGSGNPSIQAGFAQQVTGPVPVGSNKVAFLAPMLGNTYRTVVVTWRPQFGAGLAEETITMRLVAITGAQYLTISEGVSDQGNGILTMVGILDHTGFVEAPMIKAAGSPDATVTVAVRNQMDTAQLGGHWFLYRGAPVRYGIQTVLTLNQNDVAVSALTSGQAYWAVISVPFTGGAPVATKGTRATSATATIPSMPANSLQIGVVKVAYQSGGTSIISSSSITTTAFDGRYRPRKGTGLTGVIGMGRAILGRSEVRDGGPQTVTLTASATNRLWRTPLGGISVVTTDDSPPVEGSIWLATFTTDGSGVTAITDKREGRYLESTARIVKLAAAETETAAAGKYLQPVPFSGPAVIDRFITITATPSIGATGSSTFDVNRRRAAANATVFPNQGGTPESRPIVAAQGISTLAAYPEVLTLQLGDYLTLDQDGITTGGTQAADWNVLAVVYPIAG